MAKLINHQIPIEERFFATVELNENQQMIALKMLLERCIELADSTSHEINFWRSYASAFPVLTLKSNPFYHKLEKLLFIALFDESILYSAVITLFGNYNSKEAIHQIKEILSEVNSLLMQAFPFLAEINEDEDFHAQLIYQDHGIPSLFKSLNGEKLVRIIVPGKIMSMCSDLAFGKENTVKRFIAFGKFTPEDILTATKNNGRIINVNSKHIEIGEQRHANKSGPYTIQMHDYLHWSRMSATPVNVRNAIVSWAKMLSDISDYPISKFSYLLYDMDFSDFTIWDSSNYRRNSTTFITEALTGFYSKIISHLTNNNALDQHLIIVFEMLKNDIWIKTLFPECEDTIELKKRLDVALESLYLSVKDKLQYDYRIIKCGFLPDSSTSLNIFNYHLLKNFLTKVLFKASCELLLDLAINTNIFVWTRNSGLTLSHGPARVFVSKINNDNLILALKLFKSANINDKKEFNAIIERHLKEFDLNNDDENKMVSAIREHILADQDVIESCKDESTIRIDRNGDSSITLTSVKSTLFFPTNNPMPTDNSIHSLSNTVSEEKQRLS